MEELKQLLKREQDTVDYVKNSVASGIDGKIAKLAKQMIDIIEANKDVDWVVLNKE